MFGVFLFYVLSARCGGEDTTYYSALAKHASASGLSAGVRFCRVVFINF